MVLARQKAYVLKGEALQITSNGRPKLDVANTCGEAGQAKKEKLATGENYGISLSQNRMLGIDAMHKDGYNAKGVSIAVMDGGFMNADSHTVFAAMHAEGRLKGNYDMVGNGVPNYKDSDHGTEVLSCLGGYLDGLLVGGSYKADFYLFKTENVRRELYDECLQWVAAAEKADSLGVDLINTSLGYNFFDNTVLQFAVSDLTGEKNLMSKAAEIAANVGMFCVTSAGNDGNNLAWKKKITMPADADSILSVGAVREDSTIAGFSGRGPTADGRIKPDVCGQGVAAVVAFAQDITAVTRGNGTSFSGPITAGLVGGLIQKYPFVPPWQLVQAIRRTASRSGSPDTVYGYGIPNYGRISKYIEDSLTKPLPVGAPQIFPNPNQVGANTSITYTGKAGKAISIVLIDILGKQVRKQNIILNEKAVGTIPTAGLATGLYVIKIDKVGERKLIIR